MEEEKITQEILVDGLSNILRRTVEVNTRDKIAIAQHIKNGLIISLLMTLGKRRILIIDRYTFENFEPKT